MHRLIVPAAVVAGLAVLVGSALLVGRQVGFYERSNVRVAHGEPEVVVMDFSAPFSLDPLPAGWYHRTFLTRRPMDLSFAAKEGVSALRLATDDSASMLYRHVDIDLGEYPVLAWRWYVEEPIDSPLDEYTREGDDHPARLFITLRTDDHKDRPLEVIWGNRRLRAGDVKIIGGVPHYVANGGMRNVGKWIEEEIDLLEVYRRFWTDEAAVRVFDIALFADSDETETRSVSYFADVRLRRGPSARP